jgi:hypothetical protein
MRNYWVFNIGTGEYAPPEDWLAAWRHHTEEMWFPPNKRPSGVRAGDRAVIHGSLRRGFLAVVEIISSEPETNRAPKAEDRKRWPYKLRYKILVAIRADNLAPSLEDVGWENTLRLRRNPHVSIDSDMYERISRAIVAAADRAVAA